MAELEGAFIDALGARRQPRRRRPRSSISTRPIEARIRAGEDSPDLDNARSTFRALIARLGEAAAAGGRTRAPSSTRSSRRSSTLRARAREARDWATADLIRDRLAAAGVEVRDGADGSSWVLAESALRTTGGAA